LKAFYRQQRPPQTSLLAALFPKARHAAIAGGHSNWRRVGQACCRAGATTAMRSLKLLEELTRRDEKTGSARWSSRRCDRGPDLETSLAGRSLRITASIKRPHACVGDASAPRKAHAAAVVVERYLPGTDARDHWILGAWLAKLSAGDVMGEPAATGCSLQSRR
jgi:hypothetical protein